jgi:histone H3/H4
MSAANATGEEKKKKKTAKTTTTLAGAAAAGVQIHVTARAPPATTTTKVAATAKGVKKAAAPAAGGAKRAYRRAGLNGTVKSRQRMRALKDKDIFNLHFLGTMCDRYVARITNNQRLRKNAVDVKGKPVVRVRKDFLHHLGAFLQEDASLFVELGNRIARHTGRKTLSPTHLELVARTIPRYQMLGLLDQ